ncbi:MAG: hypothetical protein OXM61_17270 [Candidatus Poribacteria bacterium]|nr:hypothetical protein [Candidatus Poribacteria bacterium]
MEKKLPPKQQILQDWLIHPNTPQDAWKTMKTDEISNATGLSAGYISQILIKVVALTHGLEFGEAKQQRETARAGNKGTPTPPETIERMNELLKDKSRDEVAQILDISYSTVARHDKKRKKRRRKKK